MYKRKTWSVGDIVLVTDKLPNIPYVRRISSASRRVIGKGLFGMPIAPLPEIYLNKYVTVINIQKSTLGMGRRRWYTTIDIDDLRITIEHKYKFHDLPFELVFTK